MHATVELAGYFLAHAVWSVSDGDALIPMVGHETQGKRGLVRFAGPELQEAATKAQQFVDANPQGATRACAIIDAFVTLGDRRTDALVVTAVRYAAPKRTLQVILPYRPAKAGQTFAVFKPKFTQFDGEPAELDGAVEAFFRGVDGHAEAAKVWNAHLDQSF